MTLPIDEVLPQLRRALATHPSAVLQAPPGAGKTTRIPLALLDEPWLQGRRIIMLEPRRLAARLAASYMAAQVGESAGMTVGYRMRLDTRVSARTRVEVVTEGVFSRMLQDDPELRGIGLVIFDEFHERNLHSDLGLALCLDVQHGLRDDLRLLVMSATLDAAPVAKLLGDAPVVTSSGRSFPVDVRYIALKPDKLGERVAAAVQRALAEEQGSLLVFLPGTGEIRDVVRRLESMPLGPNVVIAPLYGNLSIQEQEHAIAPTLAPVRKVVLATSIAETSLTIEGIRVVIDAGLMRVPRFDPQSAMTQLVTISVTQATATQRAGRAGRIEPGTCWRLWSESTQKGLVAFDEPEILATDLASLVLELAQWGVTDPAQLRWVTPPPTAAFDQARELLLQLGALSAQGTITPHGRAMVQFGMHPRLAHMLLWARDHGLGGIACQLTALLSERDIFRRQGEIPPSDLALRVAALDGRAMPPGIVVDRALARRVTDNAQQLARQLGATLERRPEHEHEVGAVSARAYPDRIAQARGSDGRFRLRNGRGAKLVAHDALARAEFIVAAQLDGDVKESRIFLAADITLADINEHFAAQIERRDVVAWDSRERNVICRRELRLGELALSTMPLTDPNADQLAAALLQGVRELGLVALPWTKEARTLRARVQFLHRHATPSASGPRMAWPDWSEQGLLDHLDDWLAPYLHRMRRFEHLERLDLVDVLKSQLTWEQQRALDDQAPAALEVPSGSHIAIDYESEETPVLAVRLQELFGWQETPRLAGGTVPVKLQLLSPAFRPVQVTTDLANFWRSTYQEVKKDLKGRYPKHYWPDDPYEAEAIRGSRKPRPR